MLTWLGREQGRLSEVAFGYCAERLRLVGAHLIDPLLAQTSDALAQARILRATFDPPGASDKLTALPEAVTEEYWRELSYFGLGSSFSYALETARCLHESGRSAAALDLLVLYGKAVESPDAAELAAEAFEALLAGGLEDPELPRLSRHE